ncbi:MAG: recombination protein RecR [Halobacteriovoraceae bacterium]|nr:recombination protein RecR [Halobacteriovoraceae bacterium]
MAYKTPESIKECIQSFKKLPGVGERSAMRNILHMLAWSEDDIIQFAHSISKLLHLGQCQKCGVYCAETEKVCSLCESEERKSQKTLCVVESFTDFMAIENSEKFGGVYHILGNVLNPLLGIGPEELKISKLVNRVKEEKIGRVILAINPTVEGEATCSFLYETLNSYCVVERIGFGMPIGGSLEFLDAQTISTALQNRKPMSSI